MAHSLERTLGTAAVFSVASGAMISSGLFVLPALAYQQAGSLSIAGYALAGLLALPGLLSTLELATALPRAGGVYFYVERALGTTAGTVTGVLNWFTIALKAALAIVGMTAFFLLWFPSLSVIGPRWLGVIALSVFVLMNLAGTRSSAAVQTVLVFALLGFLAWFVLAGYRVAQFDRLLQFSPEQVRNVLPMTATIAIAYGGITKIGTLAEEVRDPTRSLVRGTMTAFGVVLVLYLAVVAVVIGVSAPAELAATLTPISDAAVRIVPRFGAVAASAASIAALLAFVTTANAGVMAAARVTLAMSRDDLLPEWVGRSGRSGTPTIPLLVTGFVMAVCIVLLDLEAIARVASAAMVLLLVFLNLAVIVVRWSKVAHYSPAFRSPLFPVPQLFGIAAAGFLIAASDWQTLLWVFGICVGSVLWYALWARKRVRRRSAFLHMLERVAGPELSDNDTPLESELLDILVQRENITEDRFDALVRDAPVIDFSDTNTRDDVLQAMAEVAAQRWQLDRESIFAQFRQREDAASTLLYPGVALPHAIPHVIVSGEHRFMLILVRNRYGIRWPTAEGDELVYTAFGLLGSKDERAFHLRALAAIAQTLQDQGFNDRWHRAHYAKELRAAVLLSRRRRSSRSDSDGS